VQKTIDTIGLMDANSNMEKKFLVLPHVQPLSEFISSNIDKSKANIVTVV